MLLLVMIALSKVINIMSKYCYSLFWVENFYWELVKDNYECQVYVLLTYKPSSIWPCISGCYDPIKPLTLSSLITTMSTKSQIQCPFISTFQVNSKSISTSLINDALQVLIVATLLGLSSAYLFMMYNNVLYPLQLNGIQVSSTM